jgi:hypothetical protein
VTSHYPLYSAIFNDKSYEHASAAWYDGEAAEHDRHGDGGTPWSETPNFESCDDKGQQGNVSSSASGSENATTACVTVKDVVEESIATLGALLDKFHVDVYAAGHVHFYSVTWPIFAGALTEKSLVNPKGTVHVVEGNGGVPTAPSRHGSSIVNCSRYARGVLHPDMDVFRKCGRGKNYGRLLTTNASVLTYEHVENANGRVTDSWSIVKNATVRP